MGRRSNSDDPYAALRRRRFESAVIGLASTRPLSSITTRSICIRAGMGRHAFYKVFESVEEARAYARDRRRQT